MSETSAGYREIPHTADWELHVWGVDLPTLLEQAARGMYALAHTTLRCEPRVVREFEIPYADPETLIVDFLSELLFFGEEETLGFDTFQISLQGEKCKCLLGGAPIEQPGKEIKAVTYHGMEVIQVSGGLEVSIVFDV